MTSTGADVDSSQPAWRSLVVAFLGVVFLLVGASVAAARTVTASWNANTDDLTAGYVLYYGTASGTYPVEIKVGDVTTYSVDLIPGATYYFVVAAYGQNGIAGPASDEASITLSNLRPVLGNPGVQLTATGNSVSLHLEATDPDGDWLVYSALGLPPTLSLDSASGMVSGTIAAGAVGTFTTTATASDRDLEDTRDFTWLVTAFGTSSSVITEGESFNVTLANAPGNPGDWAGLFRVGAPMDQPSDWKYLDGTQSRPSTGLTEATLTFSKNGLAAGNYEVRYFLTDTTAPFATSAPIVFNSAKISVNGYLAPSPVDVAVEATVSVHVDIPQETATNPGDWMGLFKVGGTIGQWYDWSYLDGSKVRPSSTTSRATVSFSVPPDPGTYEIRLFSNDSTTLLAISTTIKAAKSTQIAVNSTVPPSPVSIAPGGAAAVLVSITGPVHAGNWLGLYHTGGGIGQWVDWRYLNGTQVRPSAGLATATVTFAMPSLPGNYEVRLFLDDSATLLMTSSMITVPAPDALLDLNSNYFPPAILSASAGDTVTAGVTLTGQAHVGDWLGLYRVGGSIGQWYDWKYLNGAKVRPDEPLTSAQVPFTIPADASGDYEIRLFSDDSTTLMTASATINVAPSQTDTTELSLNFSVYPPAQLHVAAGDTVSAGVVTIQGHAGDWLGLYRIGGGLGEWCDWYYMNGTKVRPVAPLGSAVVPFTIPGGAGGNYEVRLYADDSTVLMKSSATIVASAAQTAQVAVNSTVPPTPVMVQGGDTVSVDVTIGGPLHVGDWLGIYSVGDGLAQYYDWQYLNGLKVHPVDPLSNATVSFIVPSSAGTYEIRLYANDGAAQLAASTMIVASAPASTAQVMVNGVAPPSGLSLPGGSTVTVNATIAGAVHVGDWLGLYQVGGPISQWVAWKYLNDTQVHPDVGLSTATVTFVLPDTSGDYEVRLFSNNTASLITTGPAITVP